MESSPSPVPRPPTVVSRKLLSPQFIFLHVFDFSIALCHLTFSSSARTRPYPTAGRPMSPLEGMTSIFLSGESRWTVHPLICITFWGVTQVCHGPWEPSGTYSNPPSTPPGPPVRSSGQHLLPRQLAGSVPKDTLEKGRRGEVLQIGSPLRGDVNRLESAV